MDYYGTLTSISVPCEPERLWGKADDSLGLITSFFAELIPREYGSFLLGHADDFRAVPGGSC